MNQFWFENKLTVVDEQGLLVCVLHTGTTGGNCRLPWLSWWSALVHCSRLLSLLLWPATWL